VDRRPGGARTSGSGPRINDNAAAVLERYGKSWQRRMMTTVELPRDELATSPQRMRILGHRLGVRLLRCAVIEAIDTFALGIMITAAGLTVALAAPAPDAVAAALAVVVVGGVTLAALGTGLRVEVVHAPGGSDDTIAATAEANRDVVSGTSARSSRSSASAPAESSGPSSFEQRPVLVGHEARVPPAAARLWQWLGYLIALARNKETR